MDPREVQALISLCHRYDIDCMVRSPTLERSLLYRYLEDGAAGFLIPLVPDEHVARHVVEATKFPPLGNRGIDGASLDGDYTISAWKPGGDYFEDANRQTFVIIQIETMQAVSNIDQIAAIEGVDALFIGPADLQQRLSFADVSNKTTFDEIVAKVAEATKRHGKAWGITAGSLEDLARYRQMGAQLVPWSGDFSLVNVLKQSRDDLDRVLGDG